MSNFEFTLEKYGAFKELKYDLDFISDCSYNYIEKKYGISKFIFLDLNFNEKPRLRNREINPEYIQFIKKYILQKKLRNKLTIKTTEKRSKI